MNAYSHTHTPNLLTVMCYGFCSPSPSPSPSLSHCSSLPPFLFASLAFPFPLSVLPSLSLSLAIPLIFPLSLAISLSVSLSLCLSLSLSYPLSYHLFLSLAPPTLPPSPSLFLMSTKMQARPRVRQSWTVQINSCMPTTASTHKHAHTNMHTQTYTQRINSCMPSSRRNACVAVCCSVLQWFRSIYVCQHQQVLREETHALQSVAEWCSALQSVTECCKALQWFRSIDVCQQQQVLCEETHVSQSGAVRCRTLQRVAECCKVLQWFSSIYVC